MPRKKSKEGKPEVHNELKGLELNVDQFGEVGSSIPLDRINFFLNRHVDDKKLKSHANELVAE